MAEYDKGRCVACGERAVHTTITGANGGYGPTLLPRLGRMFQPAKFEVCVCSDCGHTLFFAAPEARKKLAQNPGKWRRIE